MENEIDLDFEETYEATDLTGTGPLTKLSNEEHQQFNFQKINIDLFLHGKLELAAHIWPVSRSQ